jgi:hypothetical protein
MNPKPLYSEEWSGLDCLPENTFAIDTETTLFDEPKYNMGGTTRLSPHTSGMRLILGSIAGNGEAHVYYKRDICKVTRKVLKAGGTVIFHNAAFDINVLIDADPGLKPLFVQAMRENRIKDTKVFEQLIRIARGCSHHQLIMSTSLKDLAPKYAGMDLVKGAERTTFGRFDKFPPDSIRDRGHLQYALKDAVATYKVYSEQIVIAEFIARSYDGQYQELPDAREKFGVLAERNHVMGDIGLFWLQRHPVRVDLDLVEGGREIIDREMTRLEEAMATWTTKLMVKYKRKKGDVYKEKDVPWATRKDDGVSLSYKALRADLSVWAAEHGIVPELSPAGLITLKRDFWAEHIPRATPAQLELPDRVVNISGRLAIWMAYTRLRLLNTRYLQPLSAGERHYPNYYSIGARTTRTSASKFPIQQTPKRRDSIRGLFIPEDGAVLIEADYKAAELTGLAQALHLMFGDSTLGRSIRAGEDPHQAKAMEIWPDLWEEADEERRASLRQACKAVNFGLPGGMGAAKFAIFARGWGLQMSEEEARHLRNQALGADPELKAYLSDSLSSKGRVARAAANLGIPLDTLVSRLRAWKNEEEGEVHWIAAYKRLRLWSKAPADYAHYDIPIWPGFKPNRDLWKSSSKSPSGSIRGKALYTEAHNFPFQAAVADVGKIALFELWAAWDAECLWQPVNFIHDSITIQAKGGPDDIQYASELLGDTMKRALDEVCPDINGGVDVEPPKDRWGKLSGLFAELASEGT